MPRAYRPHLLGIDDGPFEKRPGAMVPIVGVMMEGAHTVEAVAVTEFAVDGDDVTGFLRDWVKGMRFVAALQGVVLGGITIAGLSVVDVDSLSNGLGLPVLIVNRHDPVSNRVADALAAAGLEDRKALIDRSPVAVGLDKGLFLACAGIPDEEAARMVRATQTKSLIPEPLRIAHLIGRAMVSGESRGRA
ncbi:MAG: DUF99 family protein [Candidatus Binatia bacterium]